MQTRALTAPTFLPVSLQEARDYCRIESADIEDVALTTMIRAAQLVCEDFARIAICQVDYETTAKVPVWLDMAIAPEYRVADPDNIRFRLRFPRRPVQGVTAVEVDPADACSLPDWVLDPTGDTLAWANEFVASPGADGALVRVRYTAGWPDADSVDARVKLAILETLVYAYNERGLDPNYSLALPRSATEYLKGFYRPVVAG